MLDTANRPVVLVWEVSQACDLACEHCRAEADPTRHPDELTTEEGKRLLEAVREFGPGLRVVLSGGDPLVRDDLEELVVHGTDLGLSMALTPSGTSSLTRERIDALADAGLRSMALSFDGVGESHDEFRGEPGTFDSTVEAARAASEAGLDLQVNTTVCASTVESLPAVRDLVADLDAVRWSVFFLVPVGRGALLEPIDPERADRVQAWLHEVREEASFDVKTTEAPAFRRVGLQREGQSPENARPGVLAGDGFAFVSHTGEIRPSGFFPLSAGNVREDSVVGVYRESDLFTTLRDRSKLRGKCGACEYRHVCGGSRSRAFVHTGDPTASDPLCPYVPEGYDGPVPGPAHPSSAGDGAGSGVEGGAD
jgi:radical SAM protein with 4Fe4S-binding SPASM domain